MEMVGQCTMASFFGEGGVVEGGKEDNVTMDDGTLFYHMEIMKKYMWS